MTLAEARARIGGKVVYTAVPFRPGGVDWDAERPGAGTMRFDQVAQREEGVITSVNDTYVFVRYGAEWQSKATRPEDLVTVP